MKIRRYKSLSRTFLIATEDDMIYNVNGPRSYITMHDNNAIREEIWLNRMTVESSRLELLVVHGLTVEEVIATAVRID